MLHENTIDNDYKMPEINTENGNMVLEEVDKLVDKLNEMTDNDLENIEDDIDESEFEENKLED
jgi:hypothetical protein